MFDNIKVSIIALQIYKTDNGLYKVDTCGLKESLYVCLNDFKSFKSDYKITIYDQIKIIEQHTMFMVNFNYFCDWLSNIKLKQKLDNFLNVYK